jgi:hypothetical protein
MMRPFKGRINIDIKDPVPDWEPYRQPMAPRLSSAPPGLTNQAERDTAIEQARAEAAARIGS